MKNKSYKKAFREAEKTINLPEGKTQSGKAKQIEFTGEQIRQIARDFIDEMFNPNDWEIECPICTAINCTCNDTCINCNYDLKAAK